jgi:hypothetical protein
MMPTTPSPLSAQERGRILQRILFCPTDERTARELHSMDSVERQQLWADMVGHAAAIQYRMHDAETHALLQDRMAQWEEHERAILQEGAEKEQHSQEHLEQSQQQGCTPQHPPPADVSFAGVDGRVAYRLACQQDPEWVHAQKLKFLRSEDFDVSSAINRMMRHLALKSYLFLDGNTNHDDHNTVGILGRDILLSDMSDDDMETLKSGGVQFLSICDAAGRGVFFNRYRNYVLKDRKNVVRVVTSPVVVALGRACSRSFISPLFYLVILFHSPADWNYPYCSYEPISTWFNMLFVMSNAKRLALFLSRTMSVGIPMRDTILNYPDRCINKTEPFRFDFLPFISVLIRVYGNPRPSWFLKWCRRCYESDYGVFKAPIKNVCINCTLWEFQSMHYL